MDEMSEMRLIVAFERIAMALEEQNVIREKEFERRWPTPREFREAIVTRVPTDEDRIRELHGATDTGSDWLSLEEEIGVREKEFLARQKPGGRDPETAEGQEGDPGESQTVLTDVPES